MKELEYDDRANSRTLRYNGESWRLLQKKLKPAAHLATWITPRVCTRQVELLQGQKEPSADAKVQQLPKLPPNLLNEVRQRAVAGAERGMPRPRR